MHINCVALERSKDSPSLSSLFSFVSLIGDNDKELPFGAQSGLEFASRLHFEYQNTHQSKPGPSVGSFPFKFRPRYYPPSALLFSKKGKGEEGLNFDGEKI